MQNVTLKIDGMTCGGCVKSVTRVLRELDGVAQADVSLEKAQAVVSFDENKVQPAALWTPWKMPGLMRQWYEFCLLLIH